ncbi:STAS domain-containing protein [Fluviicola taffensis]|uniref:Anti-anti-sigma factor n=1 Tax=Fluviicola taffensis (strain DSM 16823 / NCIMB 13979 / RW262) TaxID=755732 RepID=F2ID30_FLUTR|nr:STAS domain-containing protein [Fluviicola taffensis]AEA44424.1 anti-anti-sigma factor [Fluviicola taffensis DSM 16823]
MSAQFDITRSSNFVLVKVSGRIISDEGLAEALIQVDKALSSELKAVLCDCSALEYCNSTGLNFFVRVLTRSRKIGLDCVLVNLQPAVKKLIEISKLNEIFSCFNSTDEVEAKFNKIT